MRTSKFTALYYPWAAIQRPDTLKKALVFFDTVQVVCEPSEVNWIQSKIDIYPKEFKPTAKKAVADLLHFIETTKPLQEEGYLTFISPEEAMKPYDIRSLVYSSVVDDLQDNELVKNRPPFSVFGDDKFLIDYGDWGSLAMCQYFSIDFYAAYNPRGIRFSHDVPDRIVEVYTPLIDSSRILLESDNPQGFDSQSGLGVAHFVQAFAIAQAMYLASAHQACLFTDDLYMDAYLKRKCNRVLQNKEVTAKLGLTNLPSSVKGGLLAHSVIESLPDLSLESYEDVLSIRESASDEFERFHVEIEKLSTQLRSNEYSQDFFKEIDDIIKSEVNPAIVDLRTKLSQSRRKIIQKVWKRAIGGTGIPFALSIFGGLPLEKCLLASAVTVGVDIAIDTYNEILDIKEANGFSYLFNYSRK